MKTNVLMKARRATVKSLVSLKAWMLLCLVMLCVAGVKAQTPYAIWCGGDNTLYFTNSNEAYAADGTYDGKTITQVWSGDAVTNVGAQAEPQWTATAAPTCTKVVFDQSFQTVKPTSLNSWFYNMKNLTAIEGLQYLNTSEATTMRQMFTNCQNLTSLDLSHFDTRNVTNMYNMFSACLALTTLDLRSFDMGKVTTVQQMFQSCSNLTTIYCNEDWSTLSPEPTSDNLFDGCLNLKGGNNTGYDSGYKRITRAHPDGGTDAPGYFTTNKAIYVIWCEGNETLYFAYDDIRSVFFGTHKGQAVTKYWTQDYDGSLLSDRTGLPKWGGRTETNPDCISDQCVSVVIEENFKDARPTKTSSWFVNFNKLTSILGLQNLNTSEVTDMNMMFAGCYKLQSLDLSDFDTSKVTDMHTLFGLCENLKSVNLNNLNTENVTNMSEMFFGCSSLTSLDLGHFNIKKVTKMRDMFSGCSNLETIVMTIQSEAVTDMYEMFMDCSSLQNLNTENWAVNSVKNVASMFKGCSSLTSLDLSQFDTRNVTRMTEMFAGSGLKTLDIPMFNMENVEDAGGMFKDCTSLESLNLRYVKFSNNGESRSLREMFAGCSKLKTIYCDFDWTTGGVTNSTDMFAGCKSLVGANYTTYDADHTDISYARLDTPGNPGYFSKIGLEPLAVWCGDNTLFFTYQRYDDCEGYNGKIIKHIWFGDQLTDPENNPVGWIYDENTGIKSECEHVVFDPSFANVKPKSLIHWFDGMTNLKDISGLEYLNTSEVTQMTRMFADCSSLQELDLRSFDVKKVYEMTGMFANCTSLSTIHCNDDWSMENVTASGDMFEGCSSLNGYDPSNTGVGYARPNTDEAPGYFETQKGFAALWCEGNSTLYLTDKGLMHRYDNQRVTRAWFDAYKSAEGDELEAARWTYHERAEDYIADKCTKVVFDGDISFSSYRTTGLFEGFAQLSTIEGIANLNTVNVYDMSSMFSGCSSLTELDLSKFALGNIVSLSKMFYGCTNLKTIYSQSDWSDISVESSDDMFTGCSSLVGSNGTVYDESHTGIDYACIDREGKKGYFTRLDGPIYLIWCEDNTTLYLTYTNEVYNKGDKYDGQTISAVSNLTEMSGQSLYNLSSIKDRCTTLTIDESMRIVKPTDLSRLLNGYRCLTKIVGLENLNTSEATSMAYMFNGCEALKYIDISNFDTSKVTDMSYMFGGCGGLNTIAGLRMLNTANVTTMKCMFSGCSSMKELDLNNFNTGKVVDMTEMFKNCTILEYIYCDNDWKREGEVISSDNMFLGCNLRSYSADKLTVDYAHPYAEDNFGYFLGGNNIPDITAVWCEDNATLYFTCEDTPYAKSGTYNGQTITNVWTESSMYKNDAGDKMDYPRWNSDQFAADRIAEKCQNVVFASNFSEARPTITRGWFAGFSQLASISGIENLNTSKVENMVEMFKGCASLTDLDVSHFTTTVETGIDMHEMFSGCSSLTSIDLSNFNSKYVEDMSKLFYGCNSLETINLTHFENTNTMNLAQMFYGCSRLTTIYCDYDWNQARVEHAEDMFYNCDLLRGGNGTSFMRFGSSIEYARPDRGGEEETLGYFTKVNGTPYVIWCEGLKTLYFTNPLYDQYAVGDKFNASDESTITALWSGDQVTNSGDIPQWFGNDGDVERKKTCEKVIIDESFQNVKPTNLNLWFAELIKLTEIEGMQYLNTSEATSMEGMFMRCGGETLKGLDVSHFNTNKVTNMEGMFMQCANIPSLDLNSFDVSQVTSFESMFDQCTALTTIYCTNDWSTMAPESANSQNMFRGCSNLKGGNETSFSEEHQDIAYARLDTDDAPGYFSDKTAENTFYAIWCEGNTTMYLTKSDEQQLAGNYYNGQLITDVWTGNEVIEHKWHESQTSAMQNCTTINIDESFNDVKPGSFANWFADFTSVVEINGLEYLNTSEATSMSKMFFNCTQLENLDLSHFDTSKVTDMSSMFEQCGELHRIIGLRQFNTSNVRTMSSMFKGCGVTFVDLRKFDTENVRDMSYMFANCRGLQWIYCDVDWRGNGGNMHLDNHMFEGCLQLKGYKVENTDIRYAHPNTEENPGYFTSKPGTDLAVVWCEDIKTLYFTGEDVVLTKGDTYKGHEVTELWGQERPLYTLAEYTPVNYRLFNLANQASACRWLENGCNVANQCKSVVFDESVANIVPATSTVTWFYGFSELESIEGLEYLNTSEVTNMACMFAGCSSLTSLDLSSLNTEKVEYMGGMFYDCNGLTDLDVSKLNTSEVTDMSLMFANCNNLSNLNVGSFDTQKVKYMNMMFENCSSLESINVSAFNTSSVVNMEKMFAGCSSLTMLNLNKFDVSSVKYTNDMFRGCTALNTIYCGNDWRAQVSAMYSSENMFKDCDTLTGEKGSCPTEGKLDIAYAHRDLGTSDPGYFTLSTSYDFTISDAMVGTLYLEYPVSIPDADYFDAFYVKSIDDEGTMYLVKVKNVIPAYTGVVIFGNKGSYKLASFVPGDQGTTVEPTIENNLLSGVIEETSVADLQQKHGTDIYVLSLGKDSYINFRKAGGGVKTIPANRAYLPYSTASGAKELSFVFDVEDGEATGIENAATEKAERTGVYNMAGQRVAKPQHGIYIVNGKKVFIP